MVWAEVWRRGTKEDPHKDNAELEEDDLDGATIVQSPSRADTGGMSKQAAGRSAALSSDDVTIPGSSRAAFSNDDLKMPRSSRKNAPNDDITIRS
jgi:hypothetical protein